MEDLTKRYQCYHTITMSQLIVRKVDPQTVSQLKARAAAQGVSAEEAHRRILREALSRPVPGKPSLIGFLCQTEVAPEVELELSRSRDIEQRDTGF